MLQRNETTRPNSALLLVMAWAIVGIPAIWGVTKTVQTSLKLFQSPAAVAPAK